MPKVYLLDYVAGNVRSLVNAIEKVGYTVKWIKSPEDVEKADVSNIPHMQNIDTNFSCGYV
jgi:glutamine amidotransferase/cyclase